MLIFTHINSNSEIYTFNVYITNYKADIKDTLIDYLKILTTVNRKITIVHKWEKLTEEKRNYTRFAISNKFQQKKRKRKQQQQRKN